MDKDGLLDNLANGLASLEGFILPSTPPASGEEALRAASAGTAGTSTDHEERPDAALRASLHSASQLPAFHAQQRLSSAVSVRTPVAEAVQAPPGGTAVPMPGGPMLVPGSPTLAFFLQLAPPASHDLVAAALPPAPRPGPPPTGYSPPPAPGQPPPHHAGSTGRLPTPELPVERHVLKLPPPPFGSIWGAGPHGFQPDGPPVDPLALRHVLLLLTFNTPAATQAALARLHAAALASNGAAVLAALQPVPLVARLFADAAAARDSERAERCADVLLALLAAAALPLPDDVAASLVVPAAVSLLGGGAARAAAAGGAVSAAAAAASASGALSSCGLHFTHQPSVDDRRAAPAGLPTPSLPSAQPLFQHLLLVSQHSQPHQPSLPHAHTSPHAAAAAAHTAPPSCRLAAARLLLFLATRGGGPASPSAPPGVAGGAGPGRCSGAACDRLVAAGALEACAVALRDSVAVDPELQLVTLRLLAALTADASGWPWEWPVVRAAAVEGCARHTVTLLQLLSPADWWGGGAGSCGGGLVAEDAAAHEAAREVVVYLSRGPLLVREALLRAGVLAPLVEALMLWPPPGLQAAAGAATARRSSITGAVPPPPAMMAGGRRNSVTGVLPTGPGAASAGGAAAAYAGSGFSALRQHFCLCLGVLLNLSSLPRAADAPPPAGVVSPASSAFVELLLNLALDPACHPALAAAGAPATLVRSIASATFQQQLRLGPGPAGAPSLVQPWRAVAALRLVAALAADARFSAPRPHMQAELVAAGAVEEVVEEVQRTAAMLMFLDCGGGGGGDMAAAEAYERSLCALCALMTGNHEVQRSVAAAPGLLSSLAAALAAPAVMRSECRLRVTLAAWRLITAPLAAPGADADPTTAVNLLVGLGHDPDTMPYGAHADGLPAVGAAAATALFAPMAQASPPPPPLARQSVLQGAAAAAGVASTSTSGATHAPAPVRLRRRSSEVGRRAFDRISEADREGDSGSSNRSLRNSLSASAGRSRTQLWTGPQLPGTPLAAPGGAPPRELASRGGAGQSRGGGGGEGPSSLRSMERSSSSAAMPPCTGDYDLPSSSSMASKSAAALSSPRVQRPGPGPGPHQQPPHRSVFVSHDSDDEAELGPPGPGPGPGPGSGSGPASRNSSARNSQLRPAAVLAGPASAPASASVSGRLEPAQLPGALPDHRADNAPGGEGQVAAAVEGGPGSGSRIGTPRHGSPEALRLAKGSTSSFRSVGGVGAPDGGPPASPRPAATLPVRPAPASPPASARSLGDDGGYSEGAGAGRATVTEMAPPLRCLVTHLQALLGRPGCRAGAALVLVQLSRLAVVRGSAAMAAGWGPLMEAITSSLTGGAAGTDTPSPPTR
ncbi:hypothetical protein GPECTOR_64g124 [Gonium pectorale]|uniref:Uncharacterized protein n=1 Tax=Gonium pectorale TaxID=33097 RepID=A0A150G5M8_GONPE|nr:hypothetical protein GPECTOR_64g124 [Gonium pectorale]|eukprot:KXZ44630.1 hypothetical protein GPECTOR_64g124 [Gonium pectorale]